MIQLTFLYEREAWTLSRKATEKVNKFVSYTKLDH